jgi:predicted nuclease with TOPRIM domain
MPVPSVRHETDIKSDRKGSVTMTKCLLEIEKYIKFTHEQFFEVENYKREKDDCINIFEKEVEELSKSWASLQEERKLIEKSKRKLEQFKSEPVHKDGSIGRNFNQRQYMTSFRIGTAMETENPYFPEQQEKPNRYTSLSMREAQNNFSTVAVTEDERVRNQTESDNVLLMKEISDLKTKYESLKEKVEYSGQSNIHDERHEINENIKDLQRTFANEINELSSIRGKAIKLREEVHSLDAKIPGLKDKKEELEVEVRKLTREREIVKEDIISYHERSNVLNKRLEYQENSARDEVKVLNKKLDEKNSEFQDASYKEKELNLRIVHKNEELNDVNHKIRLATESYDSMNQKIKENS